MTFGEVVYDNDRQCWKILEHNWKCQKRVELTEGVKRKLTAVHKVVEEERGKIKEQIEKDEMDCIEDAQNKL